MRMVLMRAADYTDMRIALLMLMAVVLTSSVRAQDTGMIQGRVTDRVTGQGIADATIQVSSPSGLGATKSDRNGYYVFMSLPSGATRISVAAQGYSPFIILDVCVDSDQVRYVPIGLYRGFHAIASIRSTYPQWRCRFGGD